MQRGRMKNNYIHRVVTYQDGDGENTITIIRLDVRTQNLNERIYNVSYKSLKRFRNAWRGYR